VWIKRATENVTDIEQAMLAIQTMEKIIDRGRPATLVTHTHNTTHEFNRQRGIDCSRTFIIISFLSFCFGLFHLFV
jgi:hypothetical protein